MKKLTFKNLLIIFLIIFLILLILIPILKKEEDKTEYSDNPIATIEIKDMGTMEFELFPDKAPQSVYNFIDLANSGFYDGLKMHRIIPDFVAQGGDPKGDGTGGPGYSIKGEFTSNGYENDLTHKRGALAWARSQDKDSAGSQFYICLGEPNYLDKDYAVFGYMLSGEDVLDKLQKVGTTTGEPTETVIIKSVEVDTKGQEYPKPEKL